jgi:PTS system mannose-specific IIC component
MSLEAVLALLAWGTLVGLDLVSVPQIMIARPLIAGAGAGLLVGDLGAGLLVGMMFELFQYDVLPVGAVRYPEYGPASVAAVAVAHAGGADGLAAVLALGLSTPVGLVTAMAGGLSLHVLRRINARAVHAADGRLESGDPRALAWLHWSSVGRDAIRALVVTALGLGLGWVVLTFVIDSLTLQGAALLTAAAVGGAFAAAAAGLLRNVGAGANLKWLASGLAAGTLVVWLR